MNHRRCAGVLAFIAIVCLQSQNARGIDYDPSSEKLEEAVAYAQARVKKSFDAMRRSWFKRVGTGNRTVEFMIVSPFFGVVVEAWAKAKEYDTLTPAQARRIADQTRSRFRFTASFIADSRAMAREYKGFVRIAGKVVKPTHTSPPDCDPHRGRRQLCMVAYDFAISDVPADSRVTLIVVPGLGREVRARFHLGRVP